MEKSLPQKKPSKIDALLAVRSILIQPADLSKVDNDFFTILKHIVLDLIKEY